MSTANHTTVPFDEKDRSSAANGDVPSTKSSILNDSQNGHAHAHDIEKQDAPPAAAAGAGAANPEGKPSHHVNDLSSVPDGGVRAWLQVAGAFVLFLNTWGIVNTFGVYQTYYSIDILKGTSPSTIAWVGSIQAFLLLFVGMLTGPLYDMGYFRVLIITGSFLVVFGHMMLSLCTEFWQVLLAQAFTIGIGTGCLFIPSVAILSTYFTTKISIAVGLAASGSSLGGVIYPIVLHRLIPQIGFPWAVRVLGFIGLATLLVPNLVMKVRVLPATRRKLVDTSAFKSLPYMLFCVGSFITFIGMYQPFFFVQSFALEKRITSEDLSFYLLSILNATSVFGRIVPNFVAGKIGSMNLIGPCAIISGILIFCLVSVHTAAGVILFVAFFGFFSGSLVSLPPSVIVHLTPDRRFIGTRLGMCFCCVGFGTLVGGPIGGEIIKKYDFEQAWIFGGVLTVVGGLIIVGTRIAYAGWNPKLRV